MEEWRQLTDEPVAPLTMITIDGKPAYIAVIVCDVLHATTLNLTAIKRFSYNIEISVTRHIRPKEAFEMLKMCYEANVEIVCLWTEHHVCNHLCIFKRLDAQPQIDAFPLYNEVGFDNRSDDEIRAQNAQWN